MSNQNRDTIKERLKVDLEKLKITVTIIVLLTGGLIGLLFKDIRLPLNIIMFVVGIISEIILVSYLVILNTNIKNLLEKLEVIND